MDYRLLIDRDGSPYLAHATLQRGTSGQSRSNHRYIAKAQTRTGTRYFYTPQEVRAYQSGGKQTSNQVAGSKQITRQKTQSGSPRMSVGRQRHVTGTAKPGSIGRREALNNSKPVGNTALTSGQVVQEKRRSAYNSMVSEGKIKKAKEYGEAVNALGDYKKKQLNSKAALSQTKDTVKDLAKDAGYKALAAVYKLAGGDTSQINGQINNDIAMNKRYLAANVKDAKKAVGEQAKAAGKFAKELGDYAKEAGKEAAQKKASEVQDKAKEAVNKAKDWAGFDEKEKYLSTLNKRDMEAYFNTPLGKAQRAKDYVFAPDGAVQSTLWDAKENAKTKIKDIVGYDERERRDQARKKVEDAKQRGIKAYQKDQKAAAEEYRVAVAGGRENRGLSKEQYREYANKTYEENRKAASNYNDAKLDEARAQNAYDRTLLGKLDSAREFVSDTKNRINEQKEKREIRKRDKKSDSLTVYNNHIDDAMKTAKRPNKKDVEYDDGHVWNKQQMYDYILKNVQKEQERINKMSKYGVKPSTEDIDRLDRELERLKYWSSK